MAYTLSGITLILVAIATTCEGHVSLTYPPARKYPLDFLDVIRTPPPCGMSKGIAYRFFCKTVL